MEPDENRYFAGLSEGDPDVAEAFRELQDDVRSRPPERPAVAVDPHTVAERLWAVAVDVPLERSPGVRGASSAAAKRLLRPLLRWYVAPFAAEQRAFNQAILRLVDDLRARVDELERRLGRAGDDAPRP